MTKTSQLIASLRVSPQARIVYKHLVERGSISPMEGLSAHGIMRLAARIFELRQVGIPISTDLRVDAAGHPYGRYILEAA